MDVKEAVRMAKEHITELFADESIQWVGLEEVVFDDMNNVWKVTISFTRGGTLAGAIARVAARQEERPFKVVQIDDRTGRVLSMTHRTLN